MDFLIALFGLTALAPILSVLLLAVWFQDFRSPFFFATRIGRYGKPFKMVKIRSMVIDADKQGVNSTASTDSRVTPLGRVIRKYKLDELLQLWNVLVGDMSLVGPRPNTWKSGVELYTEEEKRLLSVQPGITDFASIVFADEGDILADSTDPDGDYNRLIRPWKSRLGLFYVDHRGLRLDLLLLYCTCISLISRDTALKRISDELKSQGAPDDVVAVSLRNSQLTPVLPPGSSC